MKEASARHRGESSGVPEVSYGQVWNEYHLARFDLVTHEASVGEWRRWRTYRWSSKDTNDLARRTSVVRNGEYKTRVDERGADGISARTTRYHGDLGRRFRCICSLDAGSLAEVKGAVAASWSRQWLRSGVRGLDRKIEHRRAGAIIRATALHSGIK